MTTFTTIDRTTSLTLTDSKVHTIIDDIEFNCSAADVNKGILRDDSSLHIYALSFFEKMTISMSFNQGEDISLSSEYNDSDFITVNGNSLMVTKGSVLSFSTRKLLLTSGGKNLGDRWIFANQWVAEDIVHRLVKEENVYTLSSEAEATLENSVVDSNAVVLGHEKLEKIFFPDFDINTNTKAYDNVVTTMSEFENALFVSKNDATIFLICTHQELEKSEHFRSISQASVNCYESEKSMMLQIENCLLKKPSSPFMAI